MHVPYKGAAPALQDVIAGHVQMMFATASSVVPHIRERKVRALGVATLQRTAVLPEIPTIDELGIKGFRRHHLARSGRAGAHAERDRRDAQSRARSPRSTMPAVQKSLGDLGVDIIGGSPSDSPPTSNPRSRNGPPSSRPRAPSWTSRGAQERSHEHCRTTEDRARPQRPPPRTSRPRRAPGRSDDRRQRTPMSGTSRTPSQLGTSIIDISDPRAPRVVATITLDDPDSHSHKARVAGDIMIVNHERNMSRIGRRAEQLPAARRALADELRREPTRAGDRRQAGH